MAVEPDVEKRVRDLETRFAVLADSVKKDPPKPLLLRIFSWDTAKNLMFLVGIPAGLFAAWQTLNEQVINQKEIEKRTLLATAVEQVHTLQDYNEGVFVNQAQSNDAVAFAVIEAQRGRVERLTQDLYGFWQAYPDALTRSERTTLVEALITQEQTDRALAVLESIDASKMNIIWQGDMQLLRARVLFSRGSGQDPEAARDAFGEAMKFAESHPDEGVRLGLMEKYVGVRLLNEMWLGRDCADVIPFSGFLDEMMADGTPVDAQDGIRQITRLVMQTHAQRCPPT